MAIHAAHHRCYGRFLPITCWGMSDISTQEDDGLLENGRPVEKIKNFALQACVTQLQNNKVNFILIQKSSSKGNKVLRIQAQDKMISRNSYTHRIITHYYNLDCLTT